jgi:hypothetical protein
VGFCGGNCCLIVVEDEWVLCWIVSGTEEKILLRNGAQVLARNWLVSSAVLNFLRSNSHSKNFS